MAETETTPAAEPPSTRPAQPNAVVPTDPAAEPELGGPTGPEPTRYGDWERNGRCSDF